ncbi:Rha family transcriptional regulator [Candidatus Electronema sp. JM]|uniref:Rha family transcriptional regulator n=1 Tax=Candidatus Electronema sp. JM TaxID=3401571 RepID=UPI003AA952C1
MNAASPQLSFINGHPVVTSLNLAEVFGKKHYNVLRDIKELDVPEEFNQLNFECVEYTDSKGEKRPMYRITRDGFTLLVMGFTGAKAMQFKLAYIEAFNKMEAELAARQEQSALGLRELALAMKGIVDIQIHQSKLLERLLDRERPGMIPSPYRPQEMSREEMLHRKLWRKGMAKKAFGPAEIEEVVRLRTVEELPWREISLRLNRPRSSVASVYYRLEDSGELARMLLSQKQKEVRGNGAAPRSLSRAERSARRAERLRRELEERRKKFAVGEQYALPFQLKPERKRRKINADERMRICALIRRGHSVAEIARITDRPENTLYAAVRRWKKENERYEGGAK